MTQTRCPECELATVEITSVATAAELLAALIERADHDGLDFVPEAGKGECLVYTAICSACEWHSVLDTERITFLEDPEPIG
ncbi:MAG: hypothetical protein ABR529_04775 [Actinomycetota bacterium]